jgi:hypothetical protein
VLQIVDDPVNPRLRWRELHKQRIAAKWTDTRRECFGEDSALSAVPGFNVFITGELTVKIRRQTEEKSYGCRLGKY